MIALKKDGTHGVVSCADHATVACHCDTGDRDVVLGDQLVAALVLAQIPDAHIASAIATDELALVWMDHDVVNRHPVGIVPLDIATPSVPNLDRTVFARGDQPLGFAMERNARDIAGVAVESEDRIRIR